MNKIEWKEFELEYMEAMYTGNRGDIVKIAKMLGRHHRHVSAWLRKQGLLIEKKETPEERKARIKERKHERYMNETEEQRENRRQKCREHYRRCREKRLRQMKEYRDRKMRESAHRASEELKRRAAETPGSLTKKEAARLRLIRLKEQIWSSDTTQEREEMLRAGSKPRKEKAAPRQRIKVRPMEPEREPMPKIVSRYVDIEQKNKEWAKKQAEYKRDQYEECINYMPRTWGILGTDWIPGKTPRTTFQIKLAECFC